MQCQYCGTTKSKTGNEFKTQGQLNLHEYHCKMRQGTGPQSAPAQKPQDGNCNHAWRVLSNRKADEGAAIAAGYGEVCTKCQELR